MSEKKLLLGYWAFRGLAQSVRYVLEYLSIPYEEKRYTAFDQWFGADKTSLGLEFANLPYLIDGEENFTQSFAIFVHIVKKYSQGELLGAANNDALEEARVYQMIGVVKDTAKEMGDLCFNKRFHELKEETYKTKLSGQLQKTADFLGTKDFLLGKITLADFLFYEQLQYFKHIFPLSITEQLAAYISRFENLPGIKEYLISDKYIEKDFLPPTVATWIGTR